MSPSGTACLPALLLVISHLSCKIEEVVMSPREAKGMKEKAS